MALRHLQSIVHAEILQRPYQQAALTGMLMRLCRTMIPMWYDFLSQSGVAFATIAWASLSTDLIHRAEASLGHHVLAYTEHDRS